MTDEQKNKEGIIGQPEVVPWVEFLQERPPGSTVHISGAVKLYDTGYHELIIPELQLHCPEPTCNATMFFQSQDTVSSLTQNWVKRFLTYRCRNCNKYSKMFALAVKLVGDELCEAYKFGELPPFGPPLPARVLRLIQPDRELFLSGRRCENQGLGIGAFTYYRRVVENQWARLIDEIIKVAKAINSPQPTIAALESAKSEQQFSKAVKALKDAIPPALLINGHNPLVLLHGPLSQGVHNLPDEECLSLATSIRVVLVELAEKLGQALKDEKELSDAVTKLLQVQTAKKPEE
jgi:hypothetical protein